MKQVQLKRIAMPEGDFPGWIEFYARKPFGDRVDAMRFGVLDGYYVNENDLLYRLRLSRLCDFDEALEAIAGPLAVKASKVPRSNPIYAKVDRPDLLNVGHAQPGRMPVRLAAWLELQKALGVNPVLYIFVFVVTMLITLGIVL